MYLIENKMQTVHNMIRTSGVVVCHSEKPKTIGHCMKKDTDHMDCDLVSPLLFYRRDKA